jgi:hypothetical protein
MQMPSVHMKLAQVAVEVQLSPAAVPPMAPQVLFVQLKLAQSPAAVHASPAPAAPDGSQVPALEQLKLAQSPPAEQ